MDQFFFIIGRGLVGEHIKEILDSQKQRHVFCKSRMENRESLSRELDEVLHHGPSLVVYYL